MSRPSTPCSLKLSKKDVDARDKRGHDGGGVIRPHRNVLRATPLWDWAQLRQTLASQCCCSRGTPAGR